MLVSFNARVTGGYSIFGNTFNVAFGVSYKFETLIKCCTLMGSFILLAGFEFSGTAWRCRHHAFPITSGLSVMLTGVGRRLQGTCWRVLICFWRDIFEPYISPYLPLQWNFIHPCLAISPLVCLFALAWLKGAITLLPKRRAVRG